MDSEPQIKADIQSAQAVEMAGRAAEAVEMARRAQLDSHTANTTKIFVDAMREVLTEGDEGTKALLIQKIPLLCTDILTIKADLRWIKWFIMSIAGGIGGIVVILVANKI